MMKKMKKKKKEEEKEKEEEEKKKKKKKSVHYLRFHFVLLYTRLLAPNIYIYILEIL
jgi:cytoskeletal protein RodZ